MEQANMNDSMIVFANNVILPKNNWLISNEVNEFRDMLVFAQEAFGSLSSYLTSNPPNIASIGLLLFSNCYTMFCLTYNQDNFQLNLVDRQNVPNLNANTSLCRQVFETYLNYFYIFVEPYNIGLKEGDADDLFVFRHRLWMLKGLQRFPKLPSDPNYANFSGVINSNLEDLRSTFQYKKVKSRSHRNQLERGEFPEKHWRKYVMNAAKIPEPLIEHFARIYDIQSGSIHSDGIITGNILRKSSIAIQEEVTTCCSFAKWILARAIMNIVHFTPVRKLCDENPILFYVIEDLDKSDIEFQFKYEYVSNNME